MGALYTDGQAKTRALLTYDDDALAACYTSRMSAAQGIRQRVRAELTREIKDAALRQVREYGAPALSLRAVARELGMASSAIYRYFPSRDDLLTALIVDAYEALGAAAEAADAAIPSDCFAERWMSVCRSVRAWANDHPHEYALIYGSPVPGYQAPEERTVGPATRMAAVLARLMNDAARVGALRITPGGPPLPQSVAENTSRLRQLLMNDVPEDAVARGLMAWTYLLGAVTAELFGHWKDTVGDYAEFFDYSVEWMRYLVGLPQAREFP
jgi:AcrR family transcriptional regulator